MQLYSSDEMRAMPLHSADEMRAMPLTELISHTVRLQQIYDQLEGENKFLTWELQESKDSLLYFSRAAKLAHQFNAADVDTIAALAVNELPSYFDCGYASLFFYDTETRQFSLYRSTLCAPEPRQSPHDEDVRHFLVELFLAHQEPFIVEYKDEERILVSDTDEAMTADVPSGWFDCLGTRALVLPLQIRQPDRGEPVVLGGLIMGDCRSGLESHAAEMSTIFADLLASSLYNARLVQELNAMTIIDPLTRLFNRRHLINQLQTAIAQSFRHGHPLCIAMLDIDNFKRFNDTYGHLGGDEVLREMAEILRTSVRADVDVPARYGGEEFLVIMPYVDLKQASIAADRLRRSIKAHVFEFEEHRLTVTCSFGLAQYIPGETLERFIDRADVALYQAKHGGRDRICVSTVQREGA